MFSALVSFVRNTRVLGLNLLTITAPLFGETCNALHMILELEIDIARDRFLNDKYEGIKLIVSVEKKIFRSIIRKPSGKNFNQ